jgi:hypothetical protein
MSGETNNFADPILKRGKPIFPPRLALSVNPAADIPEPPTPGWGVYHAETNFPGLTRIIMRGNDGTARMEITIRADADVSEVERERIREVTSWAWKRLERWDPQRTPLYIFDGGINGGIGGESLVGQGS